MKNLWTKHDHRQVTYTDQELDEIDEAVEQIKAEHPEFSDRAARVHEVISRHEGENGLSRRAVDYLVSAVLLLDNEHHERSLLGWQGQGEEEAGD
jgi:hypothetical protein